MISNAINTIEETCFPLNFTTSTNSIYFAVLFLSKLMMVRQLEFPLPFRLNATVAPQILDDVLGPEVSSDLEKLGVLWRPLEFCGEYLVSCGKLW